MFQEFPQSNLQKRHFHGQDVSFGRHRLGVLHTTPWNPHDMSGDCQPRTKKKAPLRSRFITPWLAGQARQGRRGSGSGSGSLSMPSPPAGGPWPCRVSGEGRGRWGWRPMEYEFQMCVWVCARVKAACSHSGTWTHFGCSSF